MTDRSRRGRGVSHLYRTEPDRAARLRPLSAANQVVLTGISKLGRSAAPVGRNITVSHTHKFLWYRVAKVATRSIYGALASSGLELELSHPSDVRYLRGTFDDYFRFAFVRNPADRFESCWRDKVGPKNLFGFDDRTLSSMRADINEFVDFAESLDLDRCDRHLRRQSRLIDLGAVDFVGRFEQLDTDFEVVARRIGRPGMGLPWANRTQTSAAERVMSPSVMQRVEAMYAEDFDGFGYR